MARATPQLSCRSATDARPTDPAACSQQWRKRTMTPLHLHFGHQSCLSNVQKPTFLMTYPGPADYFGVYVRIPPGPPSMRPQEILKRWLGDRVDIVGDGRGRGHGHHLQHLLPAQSSGDAGFKIIVAHMAACFAPSADRAASRVSAGTPPSRIASTSAGVSPSFRARMWKATAQSQELVTALVSKGPKASTIAQLRTHQLECFVSLP
ncbi:hypothetical protein EV128_11337 [Rhizobium azibense]|nr:hypothetical protein EV128_11337 [Rhizobium azibense]